MTRFWCLFRCQRLRDGRQSSDKIVKDIKRVTRKQYSSEEKIRSYRTVCAAKTALLGFAAGIAARRDVQPDYAEGLMRGL